MEDFQSAQKGGLLHSPVVMAAMVLLTFLIRAIDPGQPIVENYVGRQVPTAMVARNLDRGLGVLLAAARYGPVSELLRC